jgi:hypothetical protein
MTVNMSANRHITGGFKQESGVHPVSVVVFFVFLLTIIVRILESDFFNERKPVIEAQPIPSWMNIDRVAATNAPGRP